MAQVQYNEGFRWQSIGTAPKDGRVILGWWENAQKFACIYWDHDGVWRVAQGLIGIAPPTHWLEIPQPPKWKEEAGRS